MADIIYGRFLKDGSLHTERHPCCFGLYPYMYRAEKLKVDETYDRRVLVSTHFDGKSAAAYAKAFRATYANGFQFKRGQEVFKVEAPKIKYYGLNDKSVGINANMLQRVRAVGSKGYWQITMPATVTEWESYLFLKLFAKTGSMNNNVAILNDACVRFAAIYPKNFNALIAALGLLGVTGGYNFPITSPRTYHKPDLKRWIKGEPMVNVGAAGVFFGQAAVPGKSRKHSVGINVLPDLYGRDVLSGGGVVDKYELPQAAKVSYATKLEPKDGAYRMYFDTIHATINQLLE